MGQNATDPQQAPRRAPADMSQAELQASMGDANGDRTVSGAELIAALSNDDHSQAIDQYFYQIHNRNLIRYLELHDTPGRTAEQIRDLDQFARSNLQQDCDRAIREARTDTTDWPLKYALGAIDRIEIPADVAAVARAMGIVTFTIGPEQPAPQPPVTVTSAVPARTTTGRG